MTQNTFMNLHGGIFLCLKKEIENDKQQALDKEEKENEQIREMGELTLDQNVKRHRIELLTIIGEVEGHECCTVSK